MTDQTPVFLIFGAYGATGSALARALNDQGTVVVSGRDEEKLQAASYRALPAFSDVEQALHQLKDSGFRLAGIWFAALVPTHSKRS